MIRTTISINPKTYKAVKVKAAVTSKSISEVVNEALLSILKEDALDLAAFEERKKEPSRPFEEVLKELKRDGLL